MILNPITLPLSKYISTLTTLINDIRFNDTLVPSDIVNDLVASCRIGKVDFGKGIIYTYKEKLQDVSDLSEESTLLKINKPHMNQETIFIDKYKKTSISISEILGADAVTNGEVLTTMFSFLSSLLGDTAQFHLFDVCNAMYQDWTPGQATQTITIDLIDTTALTGVDLNAALQRNAVEIAKVIRKTANNMKIPNTKFTDITGQVTALSNTDLKYVINDKFQTNYLADAMASLYHGDNIKNMLPNESNTILLPTDSMKTGNENVIAWLSDRKKFALADFYTITMAFTDSSTLYTNTFYHFSYGNGVFKHAPGVKFVANYI